VGIQKYESRHAGMGAGFAGLQGLLQRYYSLKNNFSWYTNQKFLVFHHARWYTNPANPANPAKW
jgi:hypothetical protein